MQYLSEQNQQIPSEYNPVSVEFDDLLNLRHQIHLLRKPRKKIKAKSIGINTSGYKGRGMEFEEVRPYVAGDDIRSLDWKVTARTNEPHTKLFREERERPVLICVDMRSSMFFATKVCFKSVWVARAAALLSWKTSQLKDRVGGLIFNDEQHQEFKPKLGSRAVLGFLKALSVFGNYQSGQEPAAPTTNTAAGFQGFNARSNNRHNSLDLDMLYHSLLNLRRVTRPGSRIYILSDFRGLEARHEFLLLQLSRHNEINLIAISDPIERKLPEHGLYTVSDGMNELTFNARDQIFRKNYELRFNKRLNFLQQIAQYPNIKLFDCQTSMSPLMCVE